LAAQNRILRFHAHLTLILDPWGGGGEWGGGSLRTGEGMEQKEWKMEENLMKREEKFR
jgi:hypothetical protein